MKLNWQISAGEAFEVLRPAALVTSALLSAWVLASARRWRFSSFVAIVLSLGTLVLPFVVLPLYLVARSAAKRRSSFTERENSPNAVGARSPVRGRFVWPAVYLLFLLSAIGFYLYRDYNSVDGYLARAEQSKVVGNRPKTIREYRAALALEDNPHTHKLLGIELAGAGQWAEALSEFRRAEQGGEPDASLPFRIAQVLAANGDRGGSVLEYERFLKSQTCIQALPDDRCETARQSIGQ